MCFCVFERGEYQDFEKALPTCTFATYLKVTVQFETEGNGQNEIVSNMNRLEVKL